MANATLSNADTANLTMYQVDLQVVIHICKQLLTFTVIWGVHAVQLTCYVCLL